MIRVTTTRGPIVTAVEMDGGAFGFVEVDAVTEKMPQQAPLIAENPRSRRRLAVNRAAGNGTPVQSGLVELFEGFDSHGFNASAAI